MSYAINEKGHQIFTIPTINENSGYLYSIFESHKCLKHFYNDSYKNFIQHFHMMAYSGGYKHYLYIKTKHFILYFLLIFPVVFTIIITTVELNSTESNTFSINKKMKK